MKTLRWVILSLAVACGGASSAQLFFAQNVNSNGNVRGPRAAADAAHAAFVAAFPITGYESFELRPPGTLPNSTLFKFTGTNRTAVVSGFTGTAPWIQNLPTGTNNGCYPAHLNKYLGMGLAMNNGTAVSKTMTLVFSAAVQGFGLYITDVDNSTPKVEVTFLGGGKTTYTPPLVMNNGSIAFWGVRNATSPIIGVRLIDFGSASSDRVGIDRLTVGVVPEPGTLLVVAAGAATLLARRRRSSRKETP